MINVYDLSNATVVALFGMFAVWAAASKRHWFVRTAVVAGAILIALLIPAHEVVIMLIVQSLFVVGGIAIWRRASRPKELTTTRAQSRAPFRFRLSMQSLMLTVVIVAVAITIAAHVPALDAWNCYLFVLEGFMAGAVALTGVWIVCGRAHWWKRASALPVLVYLLALSYVSMHWGSNIARHWYLETWQSLQGSSTTEYIKLAWRDLWPSTLSWCKPVALGMIVLCAWLYCIRSAGWFDPFDDRDGIEPAVQHSRRAVIAAKTSAAGLFCIVAIFPLVLLYVLMHPTPIPNSRPPDPNGYDDLIAAGNMIGPTAARTLQNWDQLTVGQLRDELAKHQPAFDLMNEAIQRPSRNPYVFRPWPQEHVRSLIHLHSGLYAKAAMARRTNDLEQELANSVTLLRIAQEEGRGDGVKYFGGIFNQNEKDGYTGIWSCAPRLSAAMCLELVVKLRELDAQRESWAVRVAMQRAIDDNAGWERHYQRILGEWYGHDLYQWQRVEEYRRIAQLRMLIVKLAIRAFELESHRLPDTLQELVPKYMLEIPRDSFGGGPLNYRRNGEKYVLYSFGPDRDDDNGQPLVNEEGDITDADLFPPPTPPPPAAGRAKSADP